MAASPRELRAQAHENRAKAFKIANSEQRRIRLALAREYERLANAVETEQGKRRSGGDRLKS